MVSTISPSRWPSRLRLKLSTPIRNKTLSLAQRRFECTYRTARLGPSSRPSEGVSQACSGKSASCAPTALRGTATTMTSSPFS
eukprot:09247_6